MQISSHALAICLINLAYCKIYPRSYRLQLVSDGGDKYAVEPYGDESAF